MGGGYKRLRLFSGTLIATFCALLIVSVLISCEEASSDSDNTTESSGAIIATQTRKRAATDVRDSYGIFTIKTGGDTYTDYHLAVKEASETAPTATEMASGALKRNISATEIHVLIAQRMNAPMVTFAKAYFADNTQKTLGTDMAGAFQHDNDRTLALIRDADATGTNAWVAESVLKSETEYTLYGMIDGGTEVNELLSFTTDAAFVFGSKGSTIDSTTSNVVLGVVDSTLEQGHITLSVRADEYYVFPTQTDTTENNLTVSQYRASHAQNISNTMYVQMAVSAIAGGADMVFTDLLIMLPTRYSGTDYNKNYTAASYILTKPEKAQQLSSDNSWYYGYAGVINNKPTQFHDFSTLSIQ